MIRSRPIVRYTAGQRANHWLVALLFLLAGLSGLALFHPWLFGLSGLFGGGTWTRILHPWFGVAMFVFFLFLVIRFARHNGMERRDWQWLRQMNDVVANREERLPEVGRYNAGQKLLFWVLIVLMLVLLLSGLVIWRAWFSHLFDLTSLRLASVIHAAAGWLLVMSIIVHVYAGIWVKGSMDAMLFGTVSRAWARKHHYLWYQHLTGEETPTTRTVHRPPRS